VDVKRYLGWCLSRIGHYSEAIKELEQALSLEPRPGARYSAHLWLNDTYYRSGDLAKARDHLERALIDAQSTPKAQLPPDHPAFIQYGLALISYKQHRFSDAEGQLELASPAAQEPKLLRTIRKLRSLLDQAHSA
jgi:tetratricopeptide (TPR) repeat protein